MTYIPYYFKRKLHKPKTNAPTTSYPKNIWWICSFVAAIVTFILVMISNLNYSLTQIHNSNDDIRHQIDTVEWLIRSDDERYQ